MANFRVLALVVLSSCVGGLLYVYWRQCVELRGLRSANGQLRHELTSSRGDRDQVQFRLNLLREDLGAVQQAREEGEQRVQELDDQLQEERGRLRETRQELEVSNTRLETAESNARLCNDQKVTVEEVLDQLRSQLSGCEAESRDTATEKARLSKEKDVLKEEANRKRTELDHVTQQLSQAEADAQTCNRGLVACRSQMESRAKQQEMGFHEERQTHQQ
ncbi:hypothetical protein GBAR_LOCUS3814 [Geodia barretti]|uniref:Uncharacterized protein n=1 Tax=Geodia barretti TaxID=519541 RepID=A0AA35R4V4_GEOBA|nr:hypothetical protein GBAR_LOCUS3814 [Geodia barretti]